MATRSSSSRRARTRTDDEPSSVKWLARLPWWLLLLGAVLLAIAPYPREPLPHLIQKIQLLFAGNLSRPMDIFDLFLHGVLFPLLIGLKFIYRHRQPGKRH